MKSYLTIALLICHYSSLIQAQDAVSSSEWNSKVTIDGNTGEWNKPFSFYNSETGLTFAISNDSVNLYLCFIADDELKIRKMLRAGWSLEISSKEKNNKFDAKLTFPVIQMNQESKRTDNKTKKKTDMNMLFSSYKLQLQNVTAMGFKTKNGTLALKDSDGINIDLGLENSGNAVYEIAIPLRQLLSRNFYTFNEVMTLKVTVNAMSGGPAYSGGGGNHAGGGGGMRGGGMHGGGMGGGGMGGRGGGMHNGGGGGGGVQAANRAALFEKTTLTQKFKLVISK